MTVSVPDNGDGMGLVLIDSTERFNDEMLMWISANEAQNVKSHLAERCSYCGTRHGHSNCPNCGAVT